MAGVTDTLDRGSYLEGESEGRTASESRDIELDLSASLEIAACVLSVVYMKIVSTTRKPLKKSDRNLPMQKADGRH